MADVHLPGTLPPLFRDLPRRVEVDAATVDEAIEQLDARWPGLRDRLCDANGLRPGVAVAVDTQVATLGLRQPVGEHSEIHFLPAISGGSK